MNLIERLKPKLSLQYPIQPEGPDDSIQQSRRATWPQTGLRGSSAETQTITARRNEVPRMFGSSRVGDPDRQSPVEAALTFIESGSQSMETACRRAIELASSLKERQSGPEV
jgi:hypothetical protein